MINKHKIAVGKSLIPDAGLGLFALSPIKNKEILGKYVGELIPFKDDEE